MARGGEEEREGGQLLLLGDGTHVPVFMSPSRGRKHARRSDSVASAQARQREPQDGSDGDGRNRVQRDAYG